MRGFPDETSNNAYMIFRITFQPKTSRFDHFVTKYYRNFCRIWLHEWLNYYAYATKIEQVLQPHTKPGCNFIRISWDALDLG